MKLPTKVRFLSKNLKEDYSYLKPDSKLLKWLNEAFTKLEENAFCGIQIPKRLIPKEYNVNNLWKYNLPNSWWLLYSIENQDIIVVSIIIEWINHKSYDRRFRY